MTAESTPAAKAIARRKAATMAAATRRRQAVARARNALDGCPPGHYVGCPHDVDG